MSEQDKNASELYHSQEITRMKLIPYDKTAEVLQPCKEALNLPAATITPQGAAILCFAPLLSVRGNHFDAPILFQLGVKLVAIVSLVADQTLRPFVGKATFQCVFNQSHFMRRRACHVSGERKTSSVCHCHDLAAFAALGFTNGIAPFFAGANVPSIKASRKSSLPRSFKSSANTISKASKAPSFRHRWNHLWQVWYGGYRSGKSFQGAPVRRIQNMPFKTIRRSLLTGLPRPRGSWGVLHSKGAMRSHCSLVMSMPFFRTNRDNSLGYSQC